VEAASYIARPGVNSAMRKCALAAYAWFSDAGAAEWIWQSLARSADIDHRYEDLIPQQNSL
jgi:hypothetical protein